VATDRKVFGQEHSEVITDLNNLADLYAREAKQLYQQILSVCEGRLGAKHPITSSVREKYASLDT
jgi:hypothetical protein